MALTLRSTKGFPLTHDELDGNFTFLSDGTRIFATTGSNTYTGTQRLYGPFLMTGSLFVTGAGVVQLDAPTSVKDVLTIEKIVSTGTSLFKINSGGSGLGSQFDFQNYLDAGFLKLGYSGNNGNRFEFDGGSNNIAPRLDIYEKTISSPATLNIRIDGSTIGGFSYFNAGNFIIGSNTTSIYKFDLYNTGGSTYPIRVGGIPEYASNSAALTAGLTAGAFYRTGEFLKIVY